MTSESRPQNHRCTALPATADRSGARAGDQAELPGPARITRPRRICLVSSEFLGPFRTGGVGTAYTKLGEALCAAGHDVTFLYASGNYSMTEPIEHWVKHYRRRAINFVPLPECPLTLWSHAPEVAIGYRVFLWLREHDGFDIIHFPDYLGLGFHANLARRQGLAFQNCVTIVGLHGSASWCRFANQQIAKSVSDLETDFVERRAAELADIVWSPAGYMFDWVREHGWAVGERCHVQPYVVPVSESSDSESDAPQPIDELVFFGRLETRKGLNLFLDAIDEIAAAEDHSRFQAPAITFLGKPDTVHGRNSLHVIAERSAHWPFRTRVLADRDCEQAIDYLRVRGRMAVIPSLVENYPNTVLECLAWGVPFIASRVGSIPEQVHGDDVDRVCFEPSAHALADKLRLALRRGHSPAELAFDPQENTREWVRWHESITVNAADPDAAASESGCAPRETPTISVCVVHFNRPRLLRQALDSVLSQDQQPLEVIVVDDGSPGPAIQGELDAIAREYDFAGRGWQIIRQENAFLGAARNRAVSAAKGEYVLFLDDDNVAKPHEISTFVRVASRTGADVLTCLKDTFEGAHPAGVHSVPTGRVLFVGPNLRMGMFYNIFGDANAMVRRAAFCEVGGFTVDYGVGHEDWELFARMALQGYKLELIPEALFWHRETTTGLTAVTPVRRNHLRSLRPYLGQIPAEYHRFLEVCIGQSLVKSGRMISAETLPTPAYIPTPPPPAPPPPLPLRYRLADGLNARFKLLSPLHFVARRAVQGGLWLWARLRTSPGRQSHAMKVPLPNRAPCPPAKVACQAPPLERAAASTPSRKGATRSHVVSTSS
jgi:O-antigen biosynthesis protein